MSSYYPTRRIRKIIEAFEQDILEAPLRPWLIAMAADGYSQRWLSDRVGICQTTMRRILKEWGIKTSPIGPTHYGDGTFPVTDRLRRDGCYTRQNADRVRHLMRKGMSYQSAKEQTVCRSAPVAIATRMRNSGVYDDALYRRTIRRIDAGMSYEDALSSAMNHKVAA